MLLVIMLSVAFFIVMLSVIMLGVVTTIRKFILRNLRRALISKSVCPRWAFPANSMHVGKAQPTRVKYLLVSYKEKSFSLKMGSNKYGCKL